MQPPDFDWVNKWYGKVVTWLVVLLMFLPVNLALVCATAGVLGIIGNMANLSDDKTPRPSRDNSNPYISAMLRGFFVYLFLISGLLLLDTNPFSNPTPGQYIRLAGFLSIISFVVNYRPSIFSMIIVWAFNRIEEREIAPAPPPAPNTQTSILQQTTTQQTTAIQTGPVEVDGPDKTRESTGSTIDAGAESQSPK